MSFDNQPAESSLDPVRFLHPCDVIDCDHNNVRRQARKLRDDDVIVTAKRCFEFVRDEIRHSSDHQLNPVTCKASDVLFHGTGYCYAKSHFLCALLRANDIPAGLCYQRLTIADDQPSFCLHGLCSVHLPDFGWYRIDPRGNRDDIGAQFCPPVTRLAFSVDLPGEYNLPGVYVRPLPSVVQCLTRYTTWDQIASHLPDVDASDGTLRDHR